MQRDARNAANAIVRFRRLLNASLATKIKNAFHCAPGMGFLFILVALTEIYTNTLVVMFAVVSDRTIAYMVFSLTVPIRVAIFIYVSRSLSRKNWWRYWFTFDNILLLTFTISIIYGFMLLFNKATPIAGALHWRLAAVISLPLLMLSFNGNFRLLVKVYPWTPLTIFVYKSLRVYAAVMALVVQLILRSQTVTGMDPGLLILYISNLVSYHGSLLSRVPSWTAWQRSIEAKAKAAKEAGVKLVLDDIGSPKAEKPMGFLEATGYISYDEENDESVGYFQNGHANPVLGMALGTNDDIAIPVDTSNLSLLQSTNQGYTTDENSESDTFI